MKRIATILVVSALALAGCAAPAADIANKPAAPPPAPQSSSIKDVWSKIGCKEDDQMGTRGQIDLLGAPEDPVVHTGSCTPYDGGDITFYYQLPTPEDAESWVADGGLEIGTTDAVFTDGAVVILATDAGTSQKFAKVFTPFSD